MVTVLVVGGGITGLAAALELGRAGVPTELVESAERLGGKVGTEHVDGFAIERGPDAILTTRPAAISLVREVGLGDELVGVREPRTVHILHGGRLVPIPEGVGLVLPTRVRPFVGTRLFSWPEKARMALDLVLPRLAAPADEAVGAFLRRRLGRALVDRLAAPLVGGVYGTPVDQLSLDAVLPSLRQAERAHRSLLLAGLAEGRRMREAAARSGPGGGSVTPAAPGTPRPLGVFASLRGGLGDLVDAVVRAIGATGVVTTSPGTMVVALEPAGTGVRAQLSDGRVLSVESAIVATPGPRAAELVARFSPAAAAAMVAIPHGSSTVVTVAYRREAFRTPPEAHGVLIPAAAGLPVSALTWSSNKWPGRAPDETVLIRAFLTAAPATGGAPDEPVGLARGVIERLTGVRGAPELARISRFVASMPRYTVGHLGRVAQIDRELADWPAVVVAGAPYRGSGLPECIADGRAAARRVLDRIGAAAPALA